MVLMFLFNTSDFRVPLMTSAARYLRVALVGGDDILPLGFSKAGGVLA